MNNKSYNEYVQRDLTSEIIRIYVYILFTITFLTNCEFVFAHYSCWWDFLSVEKLVEKKFVQST